MPIVCPQGQNFYNIQSSGSNLKYRLDPDPTSHAKPDPDPSAVEIFNYFTMIFIEKLFFSN